MHRKRMQRSYLHDIADEDNMCAYFEYDNRKKIREIQKMLQQQ